MQMVIRRWGVMQWVYAAAGCLALFAALGCEPPQDITTPALEDTSDITVSRVDKQGLDTYLDRYLGKVVLVDFWATWCGPCTEKFPHTVALAKEYADDGLVVVTVSLDESEQFADVRRFLDQNDARPMIHLVSVHGASSESMDAFEIEGGIPFLKLYDRGGRLRYKFGPDQRVLEQRIAELLAEPDPNALSPEASARIREILGRDKETPSGDASSGSNSAAERRDASDGDKSDDGGADK